MKLSTKLQALEHYFRPPQITSQLRKQRELAKGSVGWPAYDGFLGRSLGLHFLYVRKIWPFIVLLSTVIAAVTCAGVAIADKTLNKKYYETRCYPPGEQAGALGSCLDPAAHVHSMPGKRNTSRKSVQYAWMVVLSFFSVCLNIYLAHRWKHLFFEAAGKDVMRDIAQISQAESMVNAKLNAKTKKRIGELVWSSWHKLYWTVMLLPDSIVFGTFFTPLGKSHWQYLYAALQLTGTIFALLFGGIALPLDKAWRCYPDSSMRMVTQGMCDDPKAKLDSGVFNVASTKHITFYWVTLGAMVTSFALVLTMYIVSCRHYAKWYFNHLEAQKKHLESLFDFTTEKHSSV